MPPRSTGCLLCGEDLAYSTVAQEKTCVLCQPVRAISLAAEFLDSLLHGLGLGLELSEIRLELGDHLGLAPVAAVEPAVSTVTAAPALSAVTAAPAALGGAAALTAGLALAFRLAFAVLAMMLMMVLSACLAVAHDQPRFRGLAERRSAMDWYSARNSPRCVLVLRISAAQVSRCSRPILVSS
jgi:hypothetical protein